MSVNRETVINELFRLSDKVRYVAIYSNDDLVYRQKEADIEGSSSGEADKYEELLVIQRY